MSQPEHHRAIIALMLIFFLLAPACSQPSPNHPVSPASGISLPNPTQVVRDSSLVEGTQPLAVETPGLSPTPAPSLWLASYLPDPLRNTISLPEGLALVSQPEGASLRLEVGDQNAVSHWVFALVAPFPTIIDSIPFEEILGAWQGKPSSTFSEHPLLVDGMTAGVLTAFWGAPALQAIKILPTNQLVDEAWGTRPSWAIVPFESLEPRWKVLEVDGQSPVRKGFDASAYPLTVPFSLNGDLGLQSFVRPLSLMVPASNREETRMTTLVMTGVTALVRGTSNTMYSHGVNYPAEDIVDLLRTADITHISNEVPFAESCPAYNPQQNDLTFCTYPGYIGLMEYIGTDVVELTGDHFIDWGPEATLYTLDLYKQRGWAYYGGGANLADGSKPAKLEHNGNKIAFLGCNAKRGGYATASATNPGAVPCDMDQMQQQVRQLRAEGFLPIVTFQHQEYYSYQVAPEYRPDFTRMADAGAVIVQGSQAHQPQNFEFSTNGLIHYGLGNLFFDQYNFLPETNDAFIDRHIFYDGRYISTELLTIRFVDLARSRPMTPEERQAFLKIIFKASGW